MLRVAGGGDRCPVLVPASTPVHHLPSMLMPLLSRCARPAQPRRTLLACNPSISSTCWPTFWQCTRSGNAPGLYFFMACAGAGCLFISLLSCCCFCCQRNPRHKNKNHDQFVTGAAGSPIGGMAGHDAATGGYSDQYAPGYQAYDRNYPTGKPNVAHG